MLEHFLQTAPGDGGPAGDGGGPTITIDLSGLANGIWQALLDHLGEIGTAIWTQLGQWLYSLMRGLLLTVWNATLLPIPHSTTDEFGPVQAMLPSTGAVAAAGLTLALALLGVRTILRGTAGSSVLLDHLLGQVHGVGCRAVDVALDHRPQHRC